MCFKALYIICQVCLSAFISNLYANCHFLLSDYGASSDEMERNLVSLFIRNIPDVIRDKEILKSHFCQFGKVSSICINDRHNGTINFYTHVSIAKTILRQKMTLDFL